MLVRKRTILRVFIVLSLALFGLAAAFPVWLPWLARPILSAFGVHYEAYERLGYRRLALRKLDISFGEIVATSERFEMATPPAWLWRSFGPGDSPVPLMVVDDWRVSVPPPSSPAAETSPSGGFAELLERLEQWLPTVDRWLPSATAKHGVVQIGEWRLDIERLDWRRRRLALDFAYPPHLPAARLQVDLSDAPGETPLALVSLVDVNQGLALDLTIERRQGLPHVEGLVAWQGNRIPVKAQFAREGWLPDRATAKAPAVRLERPELVAVGYAAVEGGFELNWRNDAYTLAATAQAHPATSDHPYRPPLHATLRVSGDFTGAQLQQARLTGPGVEARLDAPLAIDFRRLAIPAARIAVAVDLAHWPETSLVGSLTGTLRATPGDEGWPALAFAGESALVTFADAYRFEQVRAQGAVVWPLAEAAVGPPGLKLEATVSSATLGSQVLHDLRLEGDLDWPWIEVKSATARQGDGATVEARARLDWPARRFASFAFTATDFDPTHWLPEAVACESLSVTVRGEGQFPQVSHSGELVVEGLHAAQWPRTRLEANWRGEGLRLHEIGLQAFSQAWEVAVRGALEVDARQVHGQCERFAILHARESLAELVETSRFSFAWGDASDGWRLALENWHWRGAAGELAVTGAWEGLRKGEVELALREINFAGLDFLPQPWRGVRIETGELTGAWNDGPARFRGATSVQWRDEDTRQLRLEARLSGDANGVRIETATLADASGSALVVEGQVPLTIEPGLGAEALQWREDAPLGLEARFADAPDLWERLADWSGVYLHSPEGTLSLEGTLANPQGRITASATAVEIRRRDGALPKFEDLRLEAVVAADHFTLVELEASVEGHPVQVSGNLPLSEDFWRRRAHPETWPTVEQATARIRIDDAQIADFARFLPQALSPQGRLNVDVQVLPGLNLAGELSVVDAATRAVLPMGPIREIEAHFRFVDQRAEIVRFEGRLAGETVAVDGHLAWPAFTRPAAFLRLQGRRVPLARQPGLVLRADLDLSLSMPVDAAPTLSGTVDVRDSFYVTGWRSLLPGQPLSPPRRPPFFSVAEEPFGRWRLDVRLVGERGLRVRTPLFRGELTPDIRLQGNLAEPIAVGDVRILDGRVKFPFATIDIVQGHVSLSSDNPYRPELFVVGASRAFDYDLSLNVSGYLDDPVWEMSATPPLSPEEIILLVTAGEVPRETSVFSDRQRAGKLLLFLGRSLFAELWQDESQAERLTIRSGEGITRDGRETFSVDYRLSERWSVVGEYDEYDEFNIGIKWLIHAK